MKENHSKAAVTKWLLLLGLSAVVAILWELLELFFYGELQPRIVDDIMGGFLIVSLYYNLKSWLSED